jgi:hypothetical protein
VKSRVRALLVGLAMVCLPAMAFAPAGARSIPPPIPFPGDGCTDEFHACIGEEEVTVCWDARPNRGRDCRNHSFISIDRT